MNVIHLLQNPISRPKLYGLEADLIFRMRKIMVLQMLRRGFHFDVGGALPPSFLTKNRMLFRYIRLTAVLLLTTKDRNTPILAL